MISEMQSRPDCSEKMGHVVDFLGTIVPDTFKSTRETTLETSEEDVKPHSKRVEKM